MSVLQGILHSCANAVKQKRLPARLLPHTACTISACPAVNVGSKDLQAQCVPHGQAVESQVPCFVHLGHAQMPMFELQTSHCSIAQIYMRRLVHGASDHLCLG